MAERDESFTDTLLLWHDEHGRVFYWRETDDPFHVLVSIVFLQRTPAERVGSFVESFLEQYPSPEALASADLGELEEATRPMGLTKRVEWLQQASRTVVEEYGGEVPEDFEDLKTLAGVGDYTAAAVQCFAFDKDVPLVDVNVERLLGRYFDEDPDDHEALKELSMQLMPKGRGSDFNEALLDFPAKVCKPEPLCDTCPLSAGCYYYQSQIQSEG